MSDKKLSEKLWELDADDTDELAHAARALEERVAELERQLEFKNRCYLDYLDASSKNLEEADARAEAAEKECAELREVAAQRCTQAEAAEAELQTIRDRQEYGYSETAAHEEAQIRDLSGEVARLRELEREARERNGQYTYGLHHTRTERDAALAKAEAAEKATHAEWIAKHAIHTELTDLRNRIEALAVKYETRWPHEEGFPVDIRALLQPRKAETALDVVAELERWEFGVQKYHDQVAKLRKLLEQTPPPVPSSPACDRKS